MPAAPQKHLTSIFFATTQESQSFFFFPLLLPISRRRKKKLLSCEISLAVRLVASEGYFLSPPPPNDLSKEVPLLLSPYTVLYCRIFFWQMRRKRNRPDLYFRSFPFPRCLAYLLISSPLRCQKRFFSLTLLFPNFQLTEFPPTSLHRKKRIF